MTSHLKIGAPLIEQGKVPNNVKNIIVTQQYDVTKSAVVKGKKKRQKADCENNSFWKTLWWDMWAMMHASKVSWIGITVCGRACEHDAKFNTWIGIIVFCNRMEDMPLYHIFKLIILLFSFIMMFDTSMFLLSFDTDWAQTTLVENTGLNAV